MPFLENQSIVTPESNVSDPYNRTYPHMTPEEEVRNFYIGLFLAISSSVFTGSSFIFKKRGLLNFAKHQGTRAGQGGYGYLKEWFWWIGMILMILGEFVNFAAYTFANATLVAPLGVLSVLVSQVLSSKFLKERLNLLGKVGCWMCVVGSTVIVLHSPKEQEIASMDELIEKIKDPVFIVIAALVLIVTILTIIFLSPRYGQKTVIIYIIICSNMGSFTVLGCRGLGVALRETFKGSNEFTNWLTWVLLVVVVVCILFELNYLNRALDTYNTAVVIPVYYVFFTSVAIFMSAILFKEWGSMDGIGITTEICGFLTIIGGIFLLQAFKSMDISLSNLPKAKKEDLRTPDDENGVPVLYIQSDSEDGQSLTDNIRH